MRAGKGIRATAGATENGEPLDSERIRDFLDVARPSKDRATGLEVGEAISGPVEGDDAKTGVGCRLVSKSALEARPRMPMEVEAGLPAGIPVSA